MITIKQKKYKDFTIEISQGTTLWWFAICRDLRGTETYLYTSSAEKGEPDIEQAKKFIDDNDKLLEEITVKALLAHVP